MREYKIVAEKFLGQEEKGAELIRRYLTAVLTLREVATAIWWSEYFDFGDDPEQDWSRGMYSCDILYELDRIDMDEFLEAIDDYMGEEGEDMWEKDEYDAIKSSVEMLRKYKGYVLIITQEESKK